MCSSVGVNIITFLENELNISSTGTLDIYNLLLHESVDELLDGWLFTGW